MSERQWFKKSPVRLKPDYVTKCIPIRLFGDGVAVRGLGKSWSRSLTAITISGLINREQSCLSQFLLFVSWKKNSCSDTLKRVWAILAWSLRACFEGTVPSLDWAGVHLSTPRPHQGGRTSCVVVLERPEFSLALQCVILF